MAWKPTTEVLFMVAGLVGWPKSVPRSDRGEIQAASDALAVPLMRRIFCYLFHWRRQRHDADTHFYGWRCSVCGERWHVQRQ